MEVLATEIFKAKNDLSPKIIQEVFDLKETPYSLRPQETYFVHRNVETTHCGIQSVKYLAPKIWDLVPDQIKHFGSLNRFQTFFSSVCHQVTVLVDYAKQRQASFDQT